MYDRLPLDMVDTETDTSICKGVCLLFGSANESVTGLLLAETDDTYVLGYPSKCYYGSDPDTGEEVHSVVPYTSLPLIEISKESSSIALPIHSDLEQHYYEYMVNVISPDEDFHTLLSRYGFCPDKCTVYYSDRHLKVKQYYDTISGEVGEQFVDDTSRGETLH